MINITRILTKLHNWAIGQAWAGFFSLALPSNNSKTQYQRLFIPWTHGDKITLPKSASFCRHRIGGGTDPVTDW